MIGVSDRLTAAIIPAGSLAKVTGSARQSGYYTPRSRAADEENPLVRKFWNHLCLRGLCGHPRPTVDNRRSVGQLRLSVTN
jgi:hypothetical protein